MSAAGAGSVVLVGVQPPPVHGMAIVNAEILRRVEARNAFARVMDLAPAALKGLWARRASRVPRVVRALWRLTRCSSRDVLYMSVSGGLGQLYEIPLLLLARLRGMRTYLHHHSFAYLDRRPATTRALLASAGRATTHVCLSARMAERLQAAYPVVSQVRVLSNACWMPEAAAVPTRPRVALATVGFLGNVSVEKGVLDFLDVTAALGEQGGTVRGRLAGPIDPALERELRERLRRLPCVDYVGPQYGAAKAAFLSGLDALLFPTRYANEAEPLTVLEALMHGVPVIAYGRGCIPEVLTPACGRVVHAEQSFLAVALRQLRAWQRSPLALRAASVAAAARFDELRSRSEQSLAALMEELAPWPR